jgi:ATP-dependent DNA helicase RecG
MSDVLILTERIKNSILVGESDFREFKSALEGRPDNKKPRLVKKVCEDIAEALVAFANTDGGELIIGVEDNTEVTGVPHSDEEISVMLNAAGSHVLHGQVLPIVYKLKIEIENKTVLFFQVDKGTTEIYQLPDGRVVARKDKRTVPVRVRNLQFEQQEVKSRQYDRLFVDGAVVNDLDIQLIRTLADNYIKGLTVERYLQQLGLAEYAISGLKLRNAAVLLFSKDIQRWHPRCQVRFIRVNGTELNSGDDYNVISDEFVQGNIYELIIKSWEMLRPYLAYKTEFNSESKFEQKYIYPEDACREAILNAIAHRDYFNNNGIEVYIFNDRIEIKSPGALLSTLTITDLEALDNRHESRNVKIAYVLKVGELMREMGEGIKRIFTLMRDNELQKPKLYSNTVWFTVTLYNKSDFSAIQQEFLKLFSRYKISPLQKRILVAGMNEKSLSPDDVYKVLNTKDVNIYQREVHSLREKGILQEVTSRVNAKNIAKKKNIEHHKVPRFKVIVPLLK